MPVDIEKYILGRARELGASLVGIAAAITLKNSPSYNLLSAVGTEIDGTYATSGAEAFELSEWPETVKSILVIALSHPETAPELDWFFTSGDSVGNSNLIKINRELSIWIENNLHVKTYPMPYYVEKGGVYLKDAAVFAGLGCIGKNNLLVTSEYGPRVRLRAMLLEAELTPTGPVDFDPCKDCLEYCRKVCPQKAFADKVQLPSGIDVVDPPARDSHFRRSRCMFQMDRDWETLSDSVHALASNGMERQRVSKSANPVKYCRRCEFACPVGS